MEANNENESKTILIDEKEKKKSFISLDYNKHFLYVILCWIVEIIYRVLFMCFTDYFSITKDIVINYYSLAILSNVGDLLSGFLILYVKHISKGRRDDQTKKEEKKIKKAKKSLIRKKLLIVSILEYLGHSFHWIAYAIMNTIPNYDDFNVLHILSKDILCTVDVCMRFIFSVFILKNTIYQHGKLSILMILFGFAFLLITDFILIKFRNRNIFHSLLFSGILLFRGIAYPYGDMLTKQIFKEDSFIAPENVQFSIGIRELIIIIVITPILYFSFSIKVVFDFHPILLLTLTFYTISYLIKHFLILKIIYYFSSESVAFVSISESFALSIYGIISMLRLNYKIDTLFIIPDILGIFIILIGTLIYDEFIIINRLNSTKMSEKTSLSEPI